MKYVIIENWENMPYPSLILDLEGNTKVFDTLIAAKNEANMCHEGIIVPLNPDLIFELEQANARLQQTMLVIEEHIDNIKNNIMIIKPKN